MIQLYLIFLIGLLSIFVRYPMSWYDEQVHYARVLTYSNNLSSKSEGYITQSEQDFIHLSMTIISKSLAQESQKIISIDWKSDFNNLTDSKEKVLTKDGSTAAVYSPLVYFPYIITAWTSKLLNLSTINTFLLLRLVGFLSVFWLFLLAIRKIPFGKATLLIIGSIPTVILSFTAISADTLTYGLIFLFVS